MPDLITSENLSKELLKSVFDAAFIEASYDSDGDLKIKEDVNCFIFPNEKMKDRIGLMTMFRFEESASELQRLQMVNKINREYVMIRATVADQTLRFTYDILVNDGISRKALVLTVKRFCSIPRSAVQEYGDGIVA